MISLLRIYDIAHFVPPILTLLHHSLMGISMRGSSLSFFFKGPG